MLISIKFIKKTMLFLISNSDKKYRINNIFPTIQGEGKYAGYSAVFIRLAHCNLRCSWCDTEFDTFSLLSINEIYDRISCLSPRPPAVFVITGGEPTMSPALYPIIDFLSIYDSKIVIESNGTIEIKKDFYKEMFLSEKIHFTISPKEHTAHTSFMEPYYVNLNNWSLCKEVKLVIDKSLRDKGFEKVIELLDLFKYMTIKNKDITYSLSPEWGEMKQNINFIKILINARNYWRLSLQTHKWIGVP